MNFSCHAVLEDDPEQDELFRWPGPVPALSHTVHYSRTRYSVASVDHQVDERESMRGYVYVLVGLVPLDQETS
ncbi:MAG: hypothetical protein GY788_21010 [bacterium]|nr:hypothetical protein [bacterium]